MISTTLPPCTSDDGSGPLPCHWDAAVQGNGIGHSFTMSADGTVAYESAVSSPAALTSPSYELCDVAGALTLSAPLLGAAVFVLVKRWVQHI